MLESLRLTHYLLLLFIVMTSYAPDRDLSPWYLLAALLALSLAIAVSLLRSQAWKTGATLLAAALAVFAALRIEPLFMLLLPVSLLRLLLFHTRHFLPLLAGVLAPGLVLSGEMQRLYGLAALLTFSADLLLRVCAGRADGYREAGDQLREENERLKRNLRENDTYLRQSEYTFKLEERNRLSQDLHDHIGHAVTGALIQMQASKRILPSDPAKAEELLGNAIQISKEGLERIRLVLKQEKPTTELLGLNRLKLLADDYTAKHGVRTAVTYSGNLDLVAPVQWKVIQENVAEALTNVLKYAEATAVTLDIAVLNTMIRAVVADNGRGADKVVKGLGVRGMEERTAAVHGTIIVDGSRGFSVTMLIPRR